MNKRTMPTLFLFVIVLMASLLMAPSAKGSGILELNDSKNEYDLNPYTSVLEDKENRLVIYDLLHPDVAARFTDAGSQTINYGYSAYSHWAEFKVKNTSLKKDWLLEIAFPTLDSVDAYVLDGTNTVLQKHVGDDNAFDNREVKNRNLVLNLEIERGETLDVYLHFRTEGAAALPLKIIHPVHFAQKEQVSYLLLGANYGIIIILTIYNAFMAFFFRAKAYLYFALHSASGLIMFATLNGVAFEFLWSDAIWWNNRAIGFFMCVSHIMALLFIRNFLPPRSLSDRWKLFCNMFIVVEIFNILLMCVDVVLGLKLMLVKYLFFELLMIIPGVRALQANFRPARYYLCGWGIFAMTGIITTFTESGVIPMNSLTTFSAQIGSTLETLIVSWGLANQIKLIRKEKDRAVEQMNENRKLADSDFLTGLYNRRYIMNRFSSRMSEQMVFLILDIDHFKRINDTYGHLAGDNVLQQIASVLRQCFRHGDVIGRFGGEEFIVLMPDTFLDQARHRAEELLSAVCSVPIHIGDTHITCTVSIGITEWKSDSSDDFHAALRRADEALYEAKRLGRNRICVSSS
ncbi:sensor domain-containing diguanylate cyclase [Paenibacillus aestuarii]|uniref:Sensor domain-containing diguanylate cyclase n=1 Tax=Paenibacillus aestuarii TaxID=516965 RepID=A0ABW0K884_9BACL|nr:sensor domain-containing diguanylate cyclase [Paenibacillus aestuarii]